jgi:hypothetical protein
MNQKYVHHRLHQVRPISLEEMIGVGCAVLFLGLTAHYLIKDKEPEYNQFDQRITNHVQHSDFYRRTK